MMLISLTEPRQPRTLRNVSENNLISAKKTFCPSGISYGMLFYSNGFAVRFYSPVR